MKTATRSLTNALAAATLLFAGHASAAGWTEVSSVTAVQVWKTGIWVQISDAVSNPSTCAAQSAGWYRLDGDTASRPLLAKIMQVQSMGTTLQFYSDSCVGDRNAITAVSD